MVSLIKAAVGLLVATPLFVVFLPYAEIMHHVGLLRIDRGQRVMVCGASSGIGEQIAYQYARNGAHLALVARREKELSIVAENALKLGAASATPIVGDFAAGEDALRALVEAATAAVSGSVGSTTEEEEGLGLDVIVLNHAVQRWGWMLSSEKEGMISGAKEVVSSASPELDDAWSFDFIDKSLQINLSSYIKLAILAMPSLVRGATEEGKRQNSKSRIVVVSSGAGKVPCAKQPTYAAAKHGLHGFFDSLRLELEHKSVPVSITTVVLGLIETDTAVQLTGGDLGMPMGSAEHAALAIILGAQARLEELYYPASQQLHITAILRSVPGMRYLIDRATLFLTKGQQ